MKTSDRRAILSAVRAACRAQLALDACLGAIERAAEAVDPDFVFDGIDESVRVNAEDWRAVAAQVLRHIKTR